MTTIHPQTNPACQVASAETGSPRASRRCAFIRLLAVLGAWWILTSLVVWNVSPSLRRGPYLRIVGGPRSDSIGLICLEGWIADLAFERGYVAPGSCRGTGQAPLLKRIVAGPEETVVISADGIRVDGELLEESRHPLVDSTGRALPSVDFGERVLGQDEWWLHAPHARSFDSRIYGPVPGKWIQGLLIG